jgi:hypothetical protein
VSYVGNPFQHDVFVSYAHAERETDETMLRNWCQSLADRLRVRLATALNPTVDSNSKFSMFIDDRSLVAGDDLSAKLRYLAEHSAILLVLMSPVYARKSWCLDELHWFLGQAAKDGRGREHCVPLRIQPLASAAWPDSLRDHRGSLPVYLDFADEDTGLPFDDFDGAPGRDLLRKALVQIKSKLEDLRGRLEARRAFEREAMLERNGSLDRHIVYLHAPSSDRAAWQAAVSLLDDLAVVVPDELPTAADDDALLQRHRVARLKELRECAALLMLRASNSETFRHELMTFYRDLQQLYQDTRRRLPWAIVDQVGGSLPIAERFRVPRFIDDDWPKRVLQLWKSERDAP